mmetsp:Transcript_131927/g.246697  ORF Transcript_131927/g.246697 Transcript_131927/m.246697 type:complete len:892 (-) Transcript_131927:148-2823(-)
MPLLTKAIVIQPHRATDETQLNLNVDDVVVVTEMEASGWWGGCKEGEREKRGWFRASNVSVFQDAERTSQGEPQPGPTRTVGVLHPGISRLQAMPAAQPGSVSHRQSMDDASLPSAQSERASSRSRGSTTPPVATVQVPVQVLQGGSVTSGVLQTPRCLAVPQTAAADGWGATYTRASDGSATRASVGATTSARSSLSSCGAAAAAAAAVAAASAPAAPATALSTQQAPHSEGFHPVVDASAGTPALGEAGVRSAGTGEPPAVSRQSTANSGVGGPNVSANVAHLGDGAGDPGMPQLGLDQATAAYLESRAAELTQILSEIADVSREPRSKQDAKKSAKLQELGASLRAEREKSAELERRLQSEMAARDRAISESRALVRKLESTEARSRQLEQQAQEANERYARQLEEERARLQARVAEAEQARVAEEAEEEAEQAEAAEELERQLKEEQAQSNAYAKKLRDQQNANELMRKLYEEKLEDKDMELREVQQRLQHRDRIHEGKIRDLQAQLQSLREGSGATDMAADVPQQGADGEQPDSQQPSLADMLAEMGPSVQTITSVDMSLQQASIEATVEDPLMIPGSTTRRQLSFSSAARELDTETPTSQQIEGSLVREFEAPQENWTKWVAPPTAPEDEDDKTEQAKDDEDEQLATALLGESPSVDALQTWVEPEQLVAPPEGPSPQPPAIQQSHEKDARQASQPSLRGEAVAADSARKRPSGQGLAAQAAAAMTTASPSKRPPSNTRQSSASPRKRPSSNTRAPAARRSSSERRPPISGESSRHRLGSQGARSRGDARSESTGPSAPGTARSSRLGKETPPRGLVAEKVSIFEKRSQSPKSPRNAAPGPLRRGPQGATVPTPLGSANLQQNATRLWREAPARRGGLPAAMPSS